MVIQTRLVVVSSELLRFTTSCFLFYSGRASLSDKPGHIRMFFITINEAFPGTFRTVTELSRCIPLVLKRIREKRRRTDSKVLRVDDRDDKKCIEPLTFIDDKEESSGNWDSEDELLIEMK